VQVEKGSGETVAPIAGRTLREPIELEGFTAEAGRVVIGLQTHSANGRPVGMTGKPRIPVQIRRSRGRPDEVFAGRD
jgi:hypothetical protein